MLYSIVASSARPNRAAISWEGDSLKILRDWPKPIREEFGVALAEMQEGRAAALPVRPMPSIAAGIFELKDADEGKWYRLIYLARIKDTIYVLHCFTKNTARTERRDLTTAEQRWKQIQQRLREDQRNEKQTKQQLKSLPRDPRQRPR